MSFNTKKNIQDHFEYKDLLSFTIPSILMVLFSSIYSIVDGIYISNIDGETAFAAINFIFPYLMIFAAFGFMIGTGGNALMSKLIGEGKQDRANKVFTMLVLSLMVLGLLFTLIGELTIEPITIALGAEGELLELCVEYGRVFLLAMPFFMLQMAFQSFTVTAGKPKVGLIVTIAAGLVNIVLDAIFIGWFRWGLVGAAAASCAGQVVGGVAPIFYFIKHKNLGIRFAKFEFLFNDFVKACFNGLADFLSNISTSVVGMAYNFQLMKYFGEYGVSAYGIIMYVCYVFLAIYLGFTMGVAPLFGYQFGASNRDELKGLRQKSIRIIVVYSVILTIISEVFATPLARIFASYDAEFLSLSIMALRMYSVNYLFSGMNILIIGMFAALNNGKISSIMSTNRVLIFQLLFIFLLPVIDVELIWLATTLAEFASLIVEIIIMRKNKSKYGY